MGADGVQNSRPNFSFVRGSMLKMLGKIFSCCLLLLPVFLGAFILHTYGMNILFQDEFFLVPLVIPDHLPNLEELFQQHNQHRILFPKIVYFFISKATAMNSLAVMWASFALVAARYVAIVL
ncbi:MAG: hypothetical protein LBU39_04400 [Desulfobulbaceae bacterium]|jgi:hypothetical protein|nr:hypothetical protein [Desulfobulbaceae bacterium]